MKLNNQDLLVLDKQMLGVKACGGITVRQYQLETLEILKEIDRICKKHDIPYFLMFGSLIGAVRHRGFVPWDDDADISMTRENFNKFIEICKDELSDEYELEYYKYNMNVGLIFPRIRKKNSTYINRFEISKHGNYAGFYVDIIILDYLSEKPSRAKMQKRSLQALHRVVSPGFSQGVDSLSPFMSGCVKVLQTVLGKKRTISFFEKRLGSVKEEEAKSVIGQIMVAGRLDFCMYDKSHFETAWMVPFEDGEFPIPQKALTLLNRSYCKKLFREGTILEAGYEDEYQAILKRDYYKYDDIMYIPQNRKRNSHIDVIFDSRTESSAYDSYYFAKFNKRKNDKSAIKERKYREKSLKYLAILNANEEAAKMACEEIRIREILTSYKKKKTDKEVSIELCIAYAAALNELNIIKHMEIGGDDLQIAVEIFVKAAYLVAAKRLLGGMRKQGQMGNEKTFYSLEETLEMHIEAYYAIFENDIQYMEQYLNKYTVNDCYMVASIEGILCYEKKEYENAEVIFKNILVQNEETFLAYFYLGKIAQQTDCVDKAINYFKESLNCTLYMPLLEMSLKELRSLL